MGQCNRKETDILTWPSVQRESKEDAECFCHLKGSQSIEYKEEFKGKAGS